MHVKKFRITEGKIFKPIKGKMQQKQIWKIKLNRRKDKKEKKANKHKKCKIDIAIIQNKSNIVKM